jgi:hypothetical protein
VLLCARWRQCGHVDPTHCPARHTRPKIEIIDLGLQPWEGINLRLAVERVPQQFNKDGSIRRRPVGAYVRERTDRAPNGETWKDWLQHSRIELNAFTSAELIEWLDGKMAEYGNGKVIPPDDILHDRFAERLRPRAEQKITEAIHDRLADQVASIEAERDEATKDIRAEIDRITADLCAELGRVSLPFQQRIDSAKADASALDLAELTDEAIKRSTPDKLRDAVGKSLTTTPLLPWSTVLLDIADAIDLDGEVTP